MCDNNFYIIFQIFFIIKELLISIKYFSGHNTFTFFRILNAFARQHCAKFEKNAREQREKEKRKEKEKERENRCTCNLSRNASKQES